jgi:hypothetical protein
MTLVGSAGRPVGRFQTETALRQLAGVEVLIADAGGRRRGAPDDPAVVALRPRLDAAAAIARAAWPPSRPTCATSCCRQRRRGPARGVALRREDAPHHAIRDPDAGSDHGRGRARVRGDPARDGPHRARAVAGLAGRCATARGRRASSSAACWTRSPRSIPKPPTCSTSAARRTPGSRRSAWSGPHRPRRRSARDPVDAGLLRAFGGAMLSSPGPLDRARRRSSRSPRCPTTGARSSASRTSARTTTGCSGC